MDTTKLIQSGRVDQSRKQTLRMANVSRKPHADSDLVEILLVEDDPDDVFIIRRALRDAPVETKLNCCVHGLEALNHLRQRKGEGASDYDLVLLDLNMPVMGGLEFLKTIRADKRFANLPIVVLTTSREPDVLDAALKFGANATISKASSYEAMCDIVQSIVDLWAGAMWREHRFVV